MSNKEDFRVIIAGSREFADYDFLAYKCYLCLKDKMETHNVIIVSGAARGADKLGEQWAREVRLEIERYPAQWEKYGRSAGYKRNVEMAKIADALIAFDLDTRGTEHMVKTAEEYGLQVRHFKCVINNEQ